MNEFGFLPEPIEFDLPVGSIALSEKFTENDDYVKSNINEDDFLYPQDNKKFRGSYPTEHYLPASHSLELRNDFGGDFSRTIRKFLIHLLSFLYGTFLSTVNHFSPVYRRIPISRPIGKVRNDLLFGAQNNLNVSDSVIAGVVNRAVKKWLEWDEEAQDRIISLLEEHNRCVAYELQWEQFTFQFTVLDGFTNLIQLIDEDYERTDKFKNRVQNLLSHLEIHRHTEVEQRIADLRNDFFHESIWDKERLEPYGVEGDTDNPSRLTTIYLRKLCSRIFIKILGYNNEYANSPWRTVHKTPFEKI